MKSKIAIYIASLLMLPAAAWGSGLRHSDSTAVNRGVNAAMELTKAKTRNYDRRNILTVQVGTDIGGAIPVPFSYIPDVFVPTPKVLPNVGVRYGVVLDKGWTLGAEVSYKHVEMAADAVVQNMRAALPDIGVGGSDLVQYFSGRASMNMAFDIMEVPLYARYRFDGRGGHNILFGGYAAWVINSRFQNNPMDGFIGGEPDKVDMIITPESQIPAEQKDFSKYLSKWDAGLVVGYENSFFKRIRVGLRISMGLKDVFDVKVLEYKMLQMRGTITLSYDLWHF